MTDSDDEGWEDCVLTDDETEKNAQRLAEAAKAKEEEETERKAERKILKEKKEDWEEAYKSGEGELQRRKRKRSLLKKRPRSGVFGSLF